MAGLLDAPDRVWRWFTGLPRLWLVAAVLVGAAGLAGAALSLYRTYDYIQHDNDFCMSCHLMADPFERFAQSAHRGLGCKACHQPTFAARSQMALTQILEQPDELGVHAEVPNQRCADCHIEGDPHEWTLIENSVGHRIHLESNDPTLQGLKCVQCHSSSVHAFSPTDRTCGQAGCHERTQVRLGNMADLTIHCATCHEFNRPITGAVTSDTLAVELRPQREECLSCHQMRSMLPDFPVPDPHEGSCGSCHNPHEQTEPRQAASSCVDCHTQPEAITPYHRGLDPGAIEDCVQCHSAHRFEAHGGRCLDCHADIFQEGGAAAGRIGRSATHPGGVLGPDAPQPAGMLPVLWLQQQRADTVRFRHVQHRGVDCLECHGMENRHGSLKLVGLRDCRQCHHTQPVASRCNRCHAEPSYRATYRVPQRFRLSVGSGSIQRTLTFDHTRHDGLTCSECHNGAGAGDLSAASITCSACHASHHRVEADCLACHVQAPARAHASDQVHSSCTASGCHLAAPMEDMTWTRNLCLVCHESMTEHRPGRSCTACHAVPPPQAAAGSAVGSYSHSGYRLAMHPLPAGGRP